MSTSVLRAAAAAAALVAVIGAAAPAEAAGSARTFANCSAIHAVYSGGIAKAGVKWNRTPSGNHAIKGHAKVSTALYDVNRKSDRDGDGIACELS